jgi:hypothetical protein
MVGVLGHVGDVWASGWSSWKENVLVRFYLIAMHITDVKSTSHKTRLCIPAGFPGISARTYESQILYLEK